MNRRPTHEPSRIFPQPRRLWDDPSAHPQSLGCSTCQDLDRCGGVHTDAGVLDCYDLCTCADKSKCDMVCRFKPTHFVRRMREVGGFGFENVPSVACVGAPVLPAIIPFIDHKYRRLTTLKESVVAVSLFKVVNLATGKLHVHTREELAARFLVPSGATVMLSGVGKDPAIERWWELANRPALLNGLHQLGIALVTSPNYSVLNDVPRTDNFHAMKRILLSWREMAAAGLPAAVHVNARTEHDYTQFGNFILARPEIDLLAFEFSTGCGRGGRIDWHIAQLCGMARFVGRPLSLVIRGGGRRLHELREHFAQVALFETDSFTRTHRRRRAYFDESGRLRWARFPTPPGGVLDDLLAHNVMLVRADYEAKAKRSPQLSTFALSARRPATHRTNEALQPSLLSNLNLPGEAGAVAPERQRMIAAAKS